VTRLPEVHLAIRERLDALTRQDFVYVASARRPRSWRSPAPALWR